MNEQPVLVTTEHRGVFFGYLQGEATKEKVLLHRARNIISWSSKVRGFLGLAKSGPTNECRVGQSVPSLELFDITCVATCTSEAVARMEEAPWK